MLITLQREQSANGWTLGKLAVDGRFQCYTCEDVVRPAGEKIYGQTAIPAGRYRVIVTRSDRFSRMAGREVRLPLLVGVIGFEGIRIHSGNTAEHTEGCILPGTGHNARGVTDSVAAFTLLMAMIEAAQASGEQVWIEISQRQAAQHEVPPAVVREDVVTATPRAAPLPAQQEPGQG